MQDISTFAWLLEFICCYLRVYDGALCNVPSAFGSQFKISPPGNDDFPYFAALSCECSDGWTHPSKASCWFSEHDVWKSSGSEQAAVLTPVTNDISVSTSPQSLDRFVSVLRGPACFRWMWLPAVTLSVVSRNVSVENRKQHYYVIKWHFHEAKNWQIYCFMMHMYVLNVIYLVLPLLRFTSHLF